MITDQQIKPGPRVVVRLGRMGDSKIEVFKATVEAWTPSGRIKVVPDSGGKQRVVSADNCKLIKQ